MRYFGLCRPGSENISPALGWQVAAGSGLLQLSGPAAVPNIRMLYSSCYFLTEAAGIVIVSVHFEYSVPLP
jgi:hypothetical protein